MACNRGPFFLIPAGKDQMTSPNDDTGIANKASATDNFRRFVEDIARFRTALDDLQDPDFRIAFAKEHDLTAEAVTEDDVLAEYSEERLHSETIAFWEMIQRARLLVGRFPS
jgi:hypothetical protein